MRCAIVVGLMFIAVPALGQDAFPGYSPEGAETQEGFAAGPEGWDGLTTDLPDPGMSAAYQDEGPPPQQWSQEEMWAGFWSNLEPHGRWEEVQGRGWLWFSSAPDFRPWSDGRWVQSGTRWSYQSAAPYAWATYNYGHWTYLPGRGWAWVPGFQWVSSSDAFRTHQTYLGSGVQRASAPLIQISSRPIGFAWSGWGPVHRPVIVVRSYGGFGPFYRHHSYRHPHQRTYRQPYPQTYRQPYQQTYRTHREPQHRQPHSGTYRQPSPQRPHRGSAAPAGRGARPVHQARPVGR